MKRSRLWIFEDSRNWEEWVINKPRILDADYEFPLEFLEAKGRPWPLTDWLATIELTWRIDGNAFLKRRKEWFAVKNIEKNGSLLKISKG